LLIVPLEEARSEMKLAAPVTHPDAPDQELLRAGYVLEPSVVERMRQLGVGFIYVEYPALDALDKHLVPYLSPARHDIYKQIKQAINNSQKQTKPCVSYKDYCSSTRELIEVLMTQGHTPIYLDQMSRQGGDAVAHAAAVAHLSLLLGLKLEQYLINQRQRLAPNRAKDIVNLGIAGMLHDLGMSNLPEALHKYSDVEPPVDPAQRRDWETHPQLGFELIRHDVEPTAAAAVLQHHQHFDGSGFPAMRNGESDRGTFAGHKIHVFARIIQCANLFDRLTAPIDRKHRRSNIEVHALIASRYTAWCDPEILRVLNAIAPPYPPGSRLRLSDGTSVIVTDVSPAHPLKPIVRRLAADNWTPTGNDIDLRATGAPAIVSAA